MLPKEHRLTSSRDFEVVYKRGKGYVNRLLVLRVLWREETQPARFGFSTSPKIGSSAARNRVKRQIREAVRSLLGEIKKTGFDAILVGRPAIKEANFWSIRDAVRQLFEEAGLLQERS
ncbi:MAG: ribonuclease P protein component [Armatimonadetes bacterium]|nr:ribonuclease P protein component [Armatimonadota bacterium]